MGARGDGHKYKRLEISTTGCNHLSFGSHFLSHQCFSSKPIIPLFKLRSKTNFYFTPVSRDSQHKLQFIAVALLPYEDLPPLQEKACKSPLT
jgi:hypothetical protein